MKGRLGRKLSAPFMSRLPKQLAKQAVNIWNVQLDGLDSLQLVYSSDRSLCFPAGQALLYATRVARSKMLQIRDCSRVTTLSALHLFA